MLQKRIKPKINSLFKKKKEIKNDKNLKLKFIESKNRKIAYNSKAKDIISSTPGLIKAITEISKNNKTIIRNNFKIKRLKKLLSPKSYELSIKKKNKIEKYFIKEGDDFYEKLWKHEGFNEAKGIQILKDFGVNVIQAHFGFINKINKKSYVVYDMIDLKKFNTVYEANLSGKISDSDLKKINKKLKEINIKVNNYLKKKYSNEHLKITDMADYNTFIDLKTGELFVFDPFLVSKHVEK